MISKLPTIVELSPNFNKQASNELLNYALDAYDKVLSFGCQRYHDLYRLSVFIEALITAVCKWIQETLYSQFQEGDWHIEQRLAFVIWQKMDPNEEEIKETLSHFLTKEKQNKLRELVYHLLVSKQIKNILQGTHYEQTIMVGNLDFMY